MSASIWNPNPTVYAGRIVDVTDAPFYASPTKSATDNAAAFVAALAACADGDTLYVGAPGYYTVKETVIDAAIVLPVGVDLVMSPGAWLTADTSFGSFIAPLGRNKIKANIDGDGYPVSGGVTGTWVLENVGIRAYFNSSIGQGATNVTVHGCHIKNVSYGVQTEGAQFWKVCENTIERCKRTAVLKGFLPLNDCYGNIVTDNQFDDLGDYAVSFWQVSGVSGELSFNLVANNHARNCNQDTNGYAYGVEQGDVTRQHHMMFVGNTYETDGNVTVTTGGITISTCSDSLVSNNILSCPSGTQAKGINSTSGRNNLIANNTLDGWEDTAIDTDGGYEITLEGNNIHNCGGASPTYPVMRLAATLDTSNIHVIGGNISIDSDYALSGSTVAVILVLAAATKTVKNIDLKSIAITNPNDRCISVEGTSGIPISNVNISDLTINGIGSATFFSREAVYAIYVNDLTVDNNKIFDAKRGIAAINCDGVTLARNEFKGSQTITTLYDITDTSNLKLRSDNVTAPVTVTVTPAARMITNGNSARDCTSVVTESSGTTGAIASGATVSHGLLTTPTQVVITCTSAAVSYAVTAKTTTTFTITFTGGGTQTFDWDAKIR